MSFIGVISDKNSFQKLKKNLDIEDLNLIQINNRSIDNIKNVKFEMIIINKELKGLEEKKYKIENLCLNSKYILLNTDFNKDFYLGKTCKEKTITFGLNHKAVVTVSSITETSILVCLQKNIKDKNDNIVELGEKQIIITNDNRIKTYEILIIYIISIINNQYNSIFNSNFY